MIILQTNRPNIMYLTNILRYFRKKKYFKNSSTYWKNRYIKGGNSGSGSYGHLAEFKASVINYFLRNNSIDSVIEFGCGDGNQLTYLEYRNYIGFDISEEAIQICKNAFEYDKSKKFKHLSSFNNEKADLTLSLDVIFHLIEERVYKDYMGKLFNSSNKFVIIYSSNTHFNENRQSFHVKHRKFTDYVNLNFKDFALRQKIDNKYPFDGSDQTSFSDFYIFEKNFNLSSLNNHTY